NSDDEGNGDEDLGLNVGGEEGHVEEEDEDELYRDVNINQGRGIQATLEVKDSHMTLTLVNPDGQQQSSSVSSQFVTSMLNSTLDVGMESIFETTSQMDVQTPTSVAPLPMTAPTTTPSTIATITTTFAGAFSAILEIVQRYMDQRMHEAAKVAIQIQSDHLRDEAQRENDEFLKTTVNEQLEAEVPTRSSHSSKTSYVVVADLSEMELKKILIEKMEGNKSIQRSDEQRNLYKALVEAYESHKIILDTYGETVTLKRRRNNDADKDEKPSAGLDRGSKRRREGKDPESASAPSETATRSTTCQMEEPSHLEFDTGIEDQPIVQSSQHPEWFSQQQKPPSRDRGNITLELLASPIYELMKGSCKSLVELEYHLEEVFKATTDQLDRVNPEGQQYPHNLLKPLPLIPNNRGHHVILFKHFINNDLEYLRGGASSRKYTTSITKTKAADYGHIKWIKDLFYGFAVNRESARDVYSKRRIIAITELKIVEGHNDKHLDWITVRRDDDKLYKFKEGDFKRLRIQDIEDMLLLLIQRKLTNLAVEECFSFNVSLRISSTGSRKLPEEAHLTNPDSYRSDLKRKEAYTAYSNPRGFIYQNKDKKNRLMRIDELHKFSDGTLTYVCTALDDCLKWIQMQYLPQSIWRKSDKDRAAAMIQAIDKRQKQRGS
nr:hypothetical protein [Tanacetum cinerariifolium]